ncbi:golgi family reassembly stacking protein (GRASP like proteinue) [Trypanosoma rangeli SC58]|uniref:Golgi family reassembly stacking protein (GRASP like proteinue) n=1 Tax=Trypanosoma rangeli SC58 TaxID=429131 RepID=A0A061IVM9_TRYRA|nr:golgi family reassembly stacking protein (GRASP like proteinue) [Trypanosoma rangeli SC58]
MGQKESKKDNTLRDICGLQVARVLPGSPAHVAGLVPFFDIITAVDDVSFTDGRDAVTEFRSRVSQRENQLLSLKVYNLRVRAHRDVVCSPTSSWGGTGLLGCIIEWCHAEDCIERSWHIVGILSGTPAARCDEIEAQRDYIIGMQRPEEPVVALIKDEDDFYGRVEMWRSLQRVAFERLNRNLKNFPQRADSAAAASADLGKLIFLIYDSAANEVKEVAVDLGPDVDAPLGLDLASGLLHSLITFTSTEERKNVSESSGGTDCNKSNSNDNGGSSKNRKDNLPLMTTFFLHSGKAERCLPTVQSQTLPAMSLEQEPHTEPRETVPTRPLPLSAPQKNLSPLAFHHFPMPPSKLPAEKEGDTQGRYPFVAQSAIEMKSDMPAEAKVEAAVPSGRTFPSLGRPTIPIISRSRPTAVISNGVEGMPPAHVGPKNVAAYAPPPVMTQTGDKPQMQQDEEPLATNTSSVLRRGPVADVASGTDASLTANATVHPPLLPEFPEVPPPLHFPTIRPATPTGQD